MKVSVFYDAFLRLCILFAKCLILYKRVCIQRKENYVTSEEQSYS